jgi:hypothetical protein
VETVLKIPSYNHEFKINQSYEDCILTLTN